ncbi:RHS repeat-associated core domain-containing protein, partial [Tenacibaculum sp. FZY0031]|uniref:RHS repeat domain-containing protein n=1 Tax=Tenacibaculum sp. FZY0031 TaxID=3116648 RepID=UPI002EAAEB0E|nr:RHS repeat-associated core domain-containing protein [Tenacibaculum sp. FZY0031]
IYVYSKNDELETTDIVESKLDFSGKVLETKTTHKKSGNTDIVIVDTFNYDHMGRVLEQAQKINSQATETIVANEYDELGQLKTKKVGGTLQEVDYSYNIRGWLKNINEDGKNDNDLFNFSIEYNHPTDPLKALYNGNIAQTSWNTLNVDSSSKTYTYSYDALNRLLSATGAPNTNYNVSGITYDKNGNIIALNRNGWQNSTTFTDMDKLVYTYDNGNKLIKVLDNGNDNYGFKDGANTTTEYTYDANGNMKTDANKGITNITYNHLNLPVNVTLAGGTISYTYDATGNKLRKVANSTTTEYAGNYKYENGVLQFFNHAEGYVQKDANSFSYVYQYKDHLGNVRLSYTDNNNDGVITPSTEIIEESNYYPFGLKHKGYNNVTSPHGNSLAQKWGYNGKEYQDDLVGGTNLNWHDFGARNYDAALGRWMNLDPLAEQMRRHSPYNVSFNNPLRFIDPDGMKPEDIILLFYTKGNKEGDAAFKAAAETRKKDIESSKNFDSSKDIVLTIAVSDISEIKSKSSEAIGKYSDKYGETSEVGVWSHAGWDGPIGTKDTSENALGNSQMTLEGWGDIDFNWKSDGASCNFYGCNTGNELDMLGDEGNSFAENISSLDNFENVEVSGQQSSSYPSFSPYERRTSVARSGQIPSFGFSFGKTYMVGGSYDQGKRALGLTGGNYPKAKPFNTYKNSKFITKGYSPNQ